MDEREGGRGVWCEEHGVGGGIEADEGGEEGEGGGGEVEDVVGECFGGGEESFGGRVGERVGAAGMGFLWGYGYGAGGGGEVVDGVSDEGVAVYVEGADEGLDLGL